VCTVFCAIGESIEIGFWSLECACENVKKAEGHKKVFGKSYLAILENGHFSLVFGHSSKWPNKI